MLGESAVKVFGDAGVVVAIAAAEDVKTGFQSGDVFVINLGKRVRISNHT